MIDTDEYRKALEGWAEDPFLNRDWRDRPHRLVYDLCREVDWMRAELDEARRLGRAARAELEAMRARGGDRARLTCPHCSRLKVEEMPVLRCIKCGTGYHEEVDR